MNARYGPDTPVPIFQWEPEFSELLDLYREREPKSVLEIGSYHGGTLYHWLTNAKPGTRVVSVDSYAVGVDNRHLYETWCPEGVEVVALHGDSRAPETVAAVAEFGPYEWTFIDAGHYYHEVADDWANYGPLTKGVVCFHDILDDKYHHPEIDVQRLWREIKQEYETREIIHDPHAWWGGIGCVFTS